jgi:hypothetical protein
MSDRDHEQAPDDAYQQAVEHMLVYRAYGVADDDMDLLLQLAFIAPMCLDGKLAEIMADVLEAMHPHHAGAFIVRGIRAQAERRFQAAVECYLIGMEADLKAEESAVFALRMLDELGLAESDIATSLRSFLRESERGLAYLLDPGGQPGARRMINGSGREESHG